MDFQVLDLFSGIGSFSLAFERAGASIAAHVEIDKNCQAVLNRHSPDVPQLGDIQDVTRGHIQKAIKLICGGSPCQNLSIAGNRLGLAGTESRLWFEYLRLVKEIRPAWIVWENVPNVLASQNGRDFRTILMGLDDCGYHVAWRILDAQYFGVPQRRRRVFLVGHLGGGNAAKVLFERESYPRSHKAARQTGEQNRLAGTLAGSGAGTARPAGQANETDFLVFAKSRSDSFQESNVSNPLPARDKKDFGALVVKIDNTKSNGIGVLQDGTTHTLGGSTDAVMSEINLPRRFTPTECERLQGFPDGWTEGFSDTARYEMLGNTIAVPCSEWVARRIMAIENGEAVS